MTGADRLWCTQDGGRHSSCSGLEGFTLQGLMPYAQTFGEFANIHSSAEQMEEHRRPPPLYALAVRTREVLCRPDRHRLLITRMVKKASGAATADEVRC